MIVDTLAEAAASALAALAGQPLPVHAPPMPARPVSAPCVMVAMPSVSDMVQTSCGSQLDVSVYLLVVAGDPTGSRLIDDTDQVLAAVTAAGLTVTSVDADTYDPGTLPGPLPAARLTLE